MSKPLPKPRTHISANQGGVSPTSDSKPLPKPSTQTSASQGEVSPTSDNKEGRVAQLRRVYSAENNPSQQNLVLQKQTIITEGRDHGGDQYTSALVLHPQTQLLPKTPTEDNLNLILKKKLATQGEAHVAQVRRAYSAENNYMDPSQQKLVLQRQTTITEGMVVAYSIHSPFSPFNNAMVINSTKQWLTVESSKEPYDNQYKKDYQAFKKEEKNIQRHFIQFDILLDKHCGPLQNLIRELQEVADNLDKVFKGAKIAGITGGAAGAAGIAAAVGGVLLAPLTMGASLAVTAVGVGVAAAGGVTGASAAITNKVNNNMDRKRVEKIIKEHRTHMEEIESCFKLIRTDTEKLRSHYISELHGVDEEMVRVLKVAQVIEGAFSAISKCSGVVEGFAISMDIYFTKNNKLKKGSETKYAKQIRQVAEQMHASLDELMRVKAVLELEGI